MHPMLLSVRDTKQRADELRVELEAAQRAHHEAVLAAVNHPSDDPSFDGQAAFTVAEVASAAGVARGRIYKRMGKPTYGDRSTAKAAYQ